MRRCVAGVGDEAYVTTFEQLLAERGPAARAALAPLPAGFLTDPETGIDPAQDLPAAAIPPVRGVTDQVSPPPATF